MKDYIFTIFLDVGQSTEEAEFQVNLFNALPNLTSLTLRNKFNGSKRNEFTSTLMLTHQQVERFGQALQSCNCLCSLTLSNCSFDDDLMRLFLRALSEANGISDNVRNTLVHLDMVSSKNIFVH